MIENLAIILKVVRGLNNLIDARDRLSLTQAEMAKRLNVSLYTIKKWEKEQKYIKAYDLIKIAKSYEMTNYELLQYLMKISNNQNNKNM